MGGPRRKADPPPCSAPLPLVGRGWGWGSGNGARSGRNPSTPTPTLPHKGGGRRSHDALNRRREPVAAARHGRAKIVNMISACLDTTLTTSKCPRRRRWHSHPISSTSWARSGTLFLLTSRGASRRAMPYADEIRKAGGEVVGATGIPLGTAEMTPFLSRISGSFDGLFGIFAARDGVTAGNQAFNLGLTKKYRCRRRRHFGGHQPAGARQQDRGLRRHQSLPSCSRRSSQHAGT